MESNFHIRYIDDIHPNNAKRKSSINIESISLPSKLDPQKIASHKSKRETITRAYYIMSCSMGTCLEG
jgi:hypothetical protein